MNKTDVIKLPVQTNISPRYIGKSKHYYRQTLARADHEQTAHRIYTTLKAMSPANAGYLSLPVARKLVEQYGRPHIMDGLRVVKSRASITTPAGFLISWLRSEAKAWQNQAGRLHSTGESES